MNVEYSPRIFDTVSETVEGLIMMLQSGFENPYGRDGTVLVSIPSHSELSFLAVFGETLSIERPVDKRPYDTKMVIPVSTLDIVFRDFEILDWRSPEILGTIQLEGDLNLAFHLGMSCARPSKETLDKYSRIRELHKRKGHKNLKDVVRLHLPTQHQLLEMIEDSIPVIITGLEPTPPCKDWTMEGLVEKYGDAIVCVRSADQKQTMRELAAQMKEYQDNPELENDPNRDKAYTEGATMPEEMWDDFGPTFFDREDFAPAQLWLGSVSTKMPATGLHCDETTGFLFQVMGRKRLELYSADQADNIYTKKAYSYYQACWFNPSSPNYDVFPKAREARALSVVLNPGELLVQPAGWFHQVYALDSPTMSVSYFWRY